ncbi:HEAT repeat protein [Bremerella volcania]|uniref:HEAT repeat protein n=2 Tax=Bremerella volcania TaxID=2527984 RepID=A0A518CDP2_9BACT|nr:HEAT repeat protein [Bremerella volcania]
MSARYLFVCVALLLCGTLTAAEPDAGKLIADLKAGGDTAYQAADELADAPADKAVPALTEALGSDDSELQRRAARTLAQFGKEAHTATPALAKLLDSPIAKVRAYAAYALGKIGNGSSKALPKLIELITDEDPTVRREALEALLEMDADPNVTLPIMVDVLEKADPAMVLPVLSEMAEKGEKAIPRLRKALQNEKAAYWACLVAAEMGPDAAPAVPELTAVLDNKDPEVRMHALIALGEIGPGAKPALPRVITALQSDEIPAVKYSAAFALAAMEDAQATEALQKAAEGDDAFLSLMSYYAVAKLNPQDKQKMTTAATFLVEAMKNENPNVRAAAARCLANLEAPPEIVQPIIADALQDADPRVVVNITDAIVKMGPQVLPKVIQGLKNDKLKWISVGIIRQWGEAAPEAVGPLADALASEDEQFRAEVLMALGAIGEKSAGAIEQIRPFLKSDSRTLKLDALYALGSIGAGAISTKGEIEPLLSSEDAFTQFAAAWSLAHIAPEDADVAAKAVPVLITHLTDNSQDYIPSEAAQALAMFGEKAKSALPELKKAAEGGNEAAAEAVKAISM